MTFNFSQQKREVVYSVALVILIPAIIVAGTIWLTTKIKADYDLELQRKANLANQVFGVSATSIMAANSPEQAAPLLQQLIDSTRAQAPEIEELGISKPSTAGFTTIASSDTSEVGKEDGTPQTRLAWSKAHSVASLIVSGEGGDRMWLVATPISASGSQPVAIATIRVSLRSADALIATTLRNTLIGLVVMITVIIVLLLNHFRFVEYAELFRKQKELDQMKDDFISIATHELKSPMSVIKGYISMALEENLSDNVRDMLNIGYAQTDRLGRLVTDLLDVSRLEQGKTKYNLAPIALSDTIGPLLGTYQVKADEKGLKLEYQNTPAVPRVLADPDRVSEIFTNLIDNAIKYSRTGTVTISHALGEAGVVTTVADTGIGLTADEISHLFARFYRARNTDTADIAGTGLGLWIIKQYIEHMGGSIVVHSEKGVGTQFIVTLPMAPDAAPTASGPTAPASTPT